VDPLDTAITVDSVTYNNHGGAGPFVATLNVNSGFPLSNGMYRLYVCGTTSIVDAIDNSLALAGDGVNPGTDFVRNFSVGGQGGGGAGSAGNGNGGNAVSGASGLLPSSGFAPGHITLLPAQPEEPASPSSTNLRLEIPVLSLDIPIVGVVRKNDSWDVTWLGDHAGYLDGSAYPTWAGNTVLTGHVVNADGAPGVFAYISNLQIGDKIFIHFGRQIFVYEVRENRKVLPSALSTVFQHEPYNWVTLVTCEDFDSRHQTYLHRRFARAVLISVIPEK